ncbi:MAG: C25 family cysteine peptidase, partial [Candidatus Latescibacteria bacterium]|nr:C25 family cysteine peptidase [Candidatus Latescibacterota bacterium]
MRILELRLRLALSISCLLTAFGASPGRAAEITQPVEIPRASVSVQRAPQGDRLVVDGGSFTYTTDSGLPELPYRLVSVLLPEGETVADFEYEEGPRVRIAEGVRVTRVPDALATDGSRPTGAAAHAWSTDPVEFPAQRAVYLGTGYLHGRAIASFAVYPIRLVEGGSAVEVAEHASLRIQTAPDPAAATVVRRARYREGFHEEVERRLASLVENPRDAARYATAQARVAPARGGFQPTAIPSLEGSPVDYVIVTVDSLAASFQGLADWKTAKGVRTVVRTTEWIEANYPNGVDLAETIRTFVIDSYQHWGITYLLLGADASLIPVRLGESIFLGNKDIPADMYFGCLDGDWNADHDEFFGEVADQTDLYQEVFTGRLPAMNAADADAMVAKVMSYETPVDPSYTGKVLLLAEVLFPIDWNGSQSIAQDGAQFAEYLWLSALSDPSLTVTKMYENYVPYPPAVSESAAGAIAALNQGYDQVNHIGHGFRFNMSVGQGSIVNADADVLTNTDRYSNLYLLNCTVVAHTYFCLAEHFLANPNGGAVSVVGANESAYPLLSQPYMNEYYELVYNDDVVHIGDAVARSREPRTPLAMTSDNGDRWTHYIYTILADPEMSLWTAPVQPLTVSYPSAVGFGTHSITVNVSDPGGPLANALVCLSKDDDDYEVGTTDAGGNVTLQMTAESAGGIAVNVTAFNRARHIGSITVGSVPGPFIGFADVVIDDDAVGPSAGNGDGVIDAGETVQLTVLVENTAQLNATNVSLVLRALAGNVTVLDSTATVGSVASGQTVSAQDAFTVRFDAVIPDRTPADFTLAIKLFGITLRSDRFNRIVHAPDLDFSVLRIDDTATGNGDGVNQAGENFRLHYAIKNFGTGAGYGLTASLTDLEGAFVITDGTDAYPAVAAADGAENTDGFALHETDVSTEHDLRLDVTDAYGRTWSKVFELRPPSPPVNLAFNPSLGSDRLQVFWDGSASPDVDRYRLYRSLSAGGPFVPANPDPVHHTVYIDRGLQPTTRYYYRSTAVDASGNESAPSIVYAGRTNPKPAEGWPIAMTTETVSSPVVGDIDGDGDLEIVQGNAKMYAWHHNGVELADGDGNAQTWGLLSTQGTSFVSHTALADIDAVPGLDILAAARDTKQVFVFNYQGSVVPGWPKTVQNAIRAALVAGDIDNDGTREVIALDEKGVLYVWHANGTEFRDGDNNPATDGVFRTFPGCVYQYTCPAVADLDNDGFNEMIVGTQGDSVYVVKNDGMSIPGWPKKFNSDISGSIAVGDIDDNGDLELVVCDWAGNVYALNHDGSTLWYRFFQNQLSFGPSPALADLNGDGRLEVVLPSKNRNLYAVQWNGSDLPGWPVVYAPQLYTESSPVVGDIDADGLLDVVLGDEMKFINAWSATGQPIDGFPLALNDAVRSTPVIADVDLDGDVEIVAAGWDKSVYVWDFPGAYDPMKAPWPRFHANRYNDGNIDTVIPTPVGGVSFAYAWVERGLELQWIVPEAAGGEFTVSRAAMVGSEPGEFERVTGTMTVSLDGM